MVLKKGVVFSTDMIIALALVIAGISITLSIISNTPYSRLKEYDEHAYADSALNTMKHTTTFQDVAQDALDGKPNQAQAKLRQLIRDVYGSKRTASATIRIYDHNNTQVAEVTGSWRPNREPTAQDQVLSASRTFVKGDNTGTITLRTW